MFKIELLKGTDKIKFGMKSEEISNILGKVPQKTCKGEIDNIVDEYDFGFIYFDDSGECEGIEFFEPAKVELNGNLILGRKTKIIKKILREMDANLIIEDSDVFYSEKYSIGIYGENGKVVTVYVGKEDCYV